MSLLVKLLFPIFEINLKKKNMSTDDFYIRCVYLPLLCVDARAIGDSTVCIRGCCL